VHRIHRPGSAIAAVTGAAALLLAAPATAFASTGHAPPRAAAARDRGNLTLRQVNLASDVPGLAGLTDPDLKNPWGAALTSTSPLWVANRGTDSSTVYSLSPGSSAVTKSGAVRVTLPGSVAGPSGLVANPGTGFVVSSSQGSAPAAFIWATLDGHLEAWSPTADPLIGNAQDGATVTGAGYTGLAVARAGRSDELFAANFAQGAVDVFDSAFHPVKLAAWQFRDPGTCRSTPRPWAGGCSSPTTGLTRPPTRRASAPASGRSTSTPPAGG